MIRFKKAKMQYTGHKWTSTPRPHPRAGLANLILGTKAGAKTHATLGNWYSELRPRESPRSRKIALSYVVSALLTLSSRSQYPLCYYGQWSELSIWSFLYISPFV